MAKEQQEQLVKIFSRTAQAYAALMMYYDNLADDRLEYAAEEITEEDVIKIMPYIEKDIVRIQDPDFHSPPKVVADTNWVEDEEKRKQISKDFKEFHDSLKKR